MDNKYKLLIADDEAFMRDGLKVYIDWGDYGIASILTAGNGQEALELSRAERPDVIITDIKMPGMSGLELISSLKQTNPDSICIIISGYNDFEYAKKGIELGAFYYIVKPIEIEELKTVMSNVARSLEEKRKGKSLLSDFQESSRKTQQYLIRDFFSGFIFQSQSMTGVQYAEALKRLRLQFDYSYYAACVLRLSGKKEVSQEREDEITSAIEQKIVGGFRAFPPEMANICCIRRKGSLISIVGFSEEMALSMENENPFYGIYRSIASCFSLSLVMALGRSVPNINDLSLSYDEAERLCSYQAFLNKAGLFLAAENGVSPPGRPFILSTAEKKSFVSAIEQNNTGEIHKMLLILRQVILGQIYQDKNIIFSIILEIMISAARLLEARNIKLEQYLNIQVFTYEFLEAFENIDLLFEWLLFFFMTVSNVHSNKKNTEQEIRLIENVKRYVHDNLTGDIGLSRVAEYFHYNNNYLGRLFKKREGVKFSDYVNFHRVIHTCELLKSTDFSVERISSLAGYNDPRYFIRVFKSQMGNTPKKYRSAAVRDGTV